MTHPIIIRMKMQQILRRAANIKPVPRDMTGKLEDAVKDIGPCGILEEIRLGMCHSD